MKSAARSIWVVVVLALAIPMIVQAEFYRYEDQHGNVIYTDDLSQVPPDKRPEARMYEESQSSPASTTATEPDAKPAENEMDAIRQEGERLQAVQATLSQEYDELAKENQALKAEQQEAVTPAQIKAVNKKVVSFNARFKAYQEKESAYNADLEAYNARVKAAEAATPEKE